MSLRSIPEKRRGAGPNEQGDEYMLRVDKSSCTGCGICAENCPQQAIRIINRKASIDHRRCIDCHICVGVCPQGAISGVSAIPAGELQDTVSTLKRKTSDLLERIDKLSV